MPKNLLLLISLVSFVLLKNFTINANNDNATKFAPSVVGVINLEQILGKSLVIKSVQEQIGRITEKIQVELSDKEQKIKKMEQDLLSQKGKIADNLFEQKVAEFNKLTRELQEDAQARKTALEQANAESMRQIYNHISNIIKELSEEYGIDCVISHTQVFYIKPKMDLTEEVLKQLNLKLKTIKLNYKR